jgi:hypothetical protein
MKKIIAFVSAIFVFTLAFIPGLKDITKKSQETVARDSAGNASMKS